MLKKGRIYEVDSFQVLVFKLVSILVYVVVLSTLIIYMFSTIASPKFALNSWLNHMLQGFQKVSIEA